MQTSKFLDADMKTVAGWLRQGLDWWVEELRGLMPAALRPRLRPSGDYVEYRGSGDFARIGRGGAGPALVDPALCLVLVQEFPPLSDADLARAIALDADRILPMPAAQAVFGHARIDRDHGAVRIAALPLDRARDLLRELGEAGVVPARIGLADPSIPGMMAVDLTSGFVGAGLLPPVREAVARWWAVAAMLFALNIGVLVWRDVQEVAAFAGLVEAQAPAVAAARGISARISGTQRRAMELAERRRQRDALAVLAAATRVMPPAAWVQRFTWDGSRLRLAGYRRPQADVAAALRASEQFVEVKSNNAEAIAELPTGQPFDLTARYVGRGR